MPLMSWIAFEDHFPSGK